MSLKYATVIPGQHLAFEVLGLLSITPSFGPYWFNACDLDEGHQKGVTFSAWDADAKVMVATLTVADITADSDEPDIETLTETSTAVFDKFFQGEMARVLPADGRKLDRWMGSQLNRAADGTGLMTAYLVRQSEEPWQYAVCRLNIRNHKVAILATWQVARSNEIAKPLFDAMRSSVRVPHTH